MFHRFFYRLLNRITRLNVDIQHLLVLTFPKSQSSYRLYLLLRDNATTSTSTSTSTTILSSKLATHPVYSKNIIDHLDVPTYINHYGDGNIYSKTWCKIGIMRHRECDLPALIVYHYNGKIMEQVWYKYGKVHREGDGCAYIKYYENGQIQLQSWWKDGVRHREGDLPAIIRYYKNGKGECEVWYKDGNLIKSV